jgi:hypothetical protein
MSDTQFLSLDDIKAAASRLVEAGGDVREKLSDLTVRALAERDLAEQQIREVLSAITEGVSLGAAKRTDEVKTALADALHGVDDALTHAAEALQLTIGEAAGDIKAFSETEVQQGLTELKRLEGLFVETVSRVASGANGLVQQEMTAIAEHGRRIGTDTGERVRQVADDLGNRASRAAQAVAESGKQAALEVGARIAEKAGFKLGEIAARLTEKARDIRKN